ncbi:hypothetical protein [Streptomyces sp. ISL-11]|uniref:hypothetical protein n=1 Tax=Streptomyces sp. ISL-11 TaxID=2819174 RepID=UPI001BE62765|nr:hypothetical protein [Streptomyces sp. ISL-11]MBT2387565.1 hypothetical protein [Streptomyces sp. ISL-11]
MRIVRIGLAAAATVGALAVAVAPASAAVATAPAHTVAGAQAATPNPNTVKAAAFNQARSILAGAGAASAAKTHPVHGKSDVPVGYGTSLLAEARDEFRHDDRNLPADKKKSDMSKTHYDAIHKAAGVMGIDQW